MGPLRQDAKTTIITSRPDLVLLELTVEDATAYYDLVDRNRSHLAQHGNYLELGEATPETVVESLSDPSDENARFGIWRNAEIIGRVDLSPRTPGHFVLGYWLGNQYTGKGHATVACEAIIGFGREKLGATDIFAGVTKGNAASERLLHRLGFQAIEDRGDYTLFTLPLAERGFIGTNHGDMADG